MAIRRLSDSTIADTTVSGELAKVPPEIDDIIQYDTTNVHIIGSGFTGNSRVLLTKVNLANTDIIDVANVADNYLTSTEFREGNILSQSKNLIVIDVETWFCKTSHIIDVVQTDTGFTTRFLGSNAIVGY